MNMRLRRLANDYREATNFLDGHPSIGLLKAEGDPPEKYQFEYRLKSVEKRGEGVVPKDRHVAEVVLTLDYPGQEPICRMLTPVFHPNIDPHLICITDRWAAGESLTDVVVRIGRMLSYQTYNIKSPRNGEAAQWAAENLSRFPLDAADLGREKPAEKRDKDEIPGTAEAERAGAPSKPEPLSAPRGAKEAPVERRTAPSAETVLCANCRTPTLTGDIRECRNGHRVCPDCSVACRVCGAALCVLCDLTRCSVCQGVVCRSCQVFCHFHRQPVCREHVVVCQVCGVKGCVQCLSLCPGCGKYFCRAHYDKGRNLCAACQKKDLPEAATCPYCQKPISRKSAKFCPGCGQKF